jgi:hypothetical protein
MHRWTRALFAVLLSATAMHGRAQTMPTLIDVAPTSQPIVTVTASATSNVERSHDRVPARRADNADAAAPRTTSTAAWRVRVVSCFPAAVNGRYSRLLYLVPALAKALLGRPRTIFIVHEFIRTGETERGRLRLALWAADRIVAVTEAGSSEAATRRAAEDALTQQAIGNWRQRAQTAAQGFGAGGWRPGRITVQTNDYARPQPMFRTAGVAAASAAPVAVEGGMSDVTMTVSGEAILDTARAPR